MGSRNPGACLLARLPGATAAAAGMGEPSLRAVGALRPACQVPASRSYRSCCRHGVGTQACGQWEPRSLLAGAGYQEPQHLLQAWGIQACGQWEFWDLLARCQLLGATGASAITGEQSLWAAGALGSACWCRLLGDWYSSCCWHGEPSLLVCHKTFKKVFARTSVPLSPTSEETGNCQIVFSIFSGLKGHKVDCMLNRSGELSGHDPHLP
jgi:hypothetical protein